MFSLACFTKHPRSIWHPKMPSDGGNAVTSSSRYPTRQSNGGATRPDRFRPRARWYNLSNLKADRRMNKLLAGAAALASVLIVAPVAPAHAQAKQITLCWAAWDPANALVELSKDFTAKT